MILDKLPANHFTVEQIIKVLEKHTAKKPTVDLQFLVDNLDTMQTARNYTVKVMAQDSNGNWYSPSHVVAVVQTQLDLELLKKAIKDTAKRMGRKDVDPEKKVVAKTTVVDDLDGTTSNIRQDTKTKSKYGSKIKSGELTVNPEGTVKGEA